MPTQPLREHTLFWRDPEIHELEALRATYLTHRFAPHIHEGFAIGVIERGAERFWYRGGMHIAPSGSLVVIQPGEMHTGSALSEHGWSYRMIYPEAPLLTRVAAEAAGRSPQHLPFFRSPVLSDPQLAQALLQMHTVLETSPSPLERQSSLLEALAQLIHRHAYHRLDLTSVSAEPPIVRIIQDYLEAHLDEQISLDQLADLVQRSPYHLLRVFRKTVGLPPHRYLTQLRVLRAKSLLLSGVPPAQAALSLGFTDQSHLNRHFKRIVGVSPGYYATSNIRGSSIP